VPGFSLLATTTHRPKTYSTVLRTTAHNIIIIIIIIIMRLFGIPKLLMAVALLTELPAFVTARAILGVDLGSLYMKVALVQSGSPLEIVTNLHSKRKTEQMILFDNNQRFYGADASALLARKSQKTPAAMSVLLGRDDQHPVVEVSFHYSGLLFSLFFMYLCVMAMSGLCYGKDKNKVSHHIFYSSLIDGYFHPCVISLSLLVVTVGSRGTSLSSAPRVQ